MSTVPPLLQAADSYNFVAAGFVVAALVCTSQRGFVVRQITYETYTKTYTSVLGIFLKRVTSIGDVGSKETRRINIKSCIL